jgi:hypothetical protein
LMSAIEELSTRIVDMKALLSARFGFRRYAPSNTPREPPQNQDAPRILRALGPH